MRGASRPPQRRERERMERWRVVDRTEKTRGKDIGGANVAAKN